MLSTPSSEYSSITDANNLLADTDNDSIFLFHCNIRSLPKTSSFYMTFYTVLIIYLM